MSHVTCFQHIDCEGPGSVLEILKNKNIALKVVKPFRGENIPEKIGDGLIVLGGPMGVYEQNEYSWMNLEISAIQECLKKQIPVLGICLGAQMLAHAAGGTVYKGIQPEVGWYPIRLSNEGRWDPLLLGLPEEVMAFHWHGDTFSLPLDAVRLAGSSNYPNQLFKLGNNAYGFQCHLETTEEMIKEWVLVYEKELEPKGSLPRQPIEKNLQANASNLRNTAETVFSRFAALL